MARKASVVIEKDEHGFYAWCPELKGCQSQGDTLEEAIANIKEAIELYLETLPEDERDFLLSREILTTSVEVNGRAGRRQTPSLRAVALERQSPEFRTWFLAEIPFHGGAMLHPKIVKQAWEQIEAAKSTPGLED
jgi:predicted RNase H-like HicB family nuclease